MNSSMDAASAGSAASADPPENFSPKSGRVDRKAWKPMEITRDINVVEANAVNSNRVMD